MKVVLEPFKSHLKRKIGKCFLFIVVKYDLRKTAYQNYGAYLVKTLQDMPLGDIFGAKRIFFVSHDFNTDCHKKNVPAYTNY